jgi:hypothetical protein
MIVIPCNQPVYIDVDDTLLMWEKPSPNDPRAIAVKCPSERYKRAIDEMGIETDELVIEKGEWVEYLIPHIKHIEQLKAHKLRQHTVIVWSAGGWQWAKCAVEALGLTEFVDVVMEKPMWCYDDLPPSEFMPKNQWLKNE